MEKYYEDSKDKGYRNNNRGILISFEGCAKSGKSTQIKLLADRLRKDGHRVEIFKFPDRNTYTGDLLNRQNSAETVSPEVLALLHTANRWEVLPYVRNALRHGTHVLLERWVESSCVYGALTTGHSLHWGLDINANLPRSDIVIGLDIDSELQESRCNWGDKPFEKRVLQYHLRKKYDSLRCRGASEKWCCFDASLEKHTLSNLIYRTVEPLLRSEREDVDSISKY